MKFAASALFLLSLVKGARSVEYKCCKSDYTGVDDWSRQRICEEADPSITAETWEEAWEDIFYVESTCIDPPTFVDLYMGGMAGIHSDMQGVLALAANACAKASPPGQLCGSAADKMYCCPTDSQDGGLACGSVNSGSDNIFNCLPVEDVITSEQICEFFTTFSALCDCDEMSCTAPLIEGGGGAYGDPHIKTMNGKYFDFHGECDLVLAEAREFGHGLGLDIHIRTKIRYEYSYIESAAVKIGEDILEVFSYGSYAYNGISAAAFESEKMAGKYPVTYEQVSDKVHKFTIKTGESEQIVVSTLKDLVAVRLQNVTHANFGGTVGLMGTYDGHLQSRDGTGGTFVLDPVAFGQEWQVNNEDPKIFLTDRHPQYPTKCIMPTPVQDKERSRRLQDGGISKEAAEEACAHFKGDEKKMCVFDVLAMQDLDIAKSGAF